MAIKDIKKLPDEKNIADLLDEETLGKIARRVIEDYTEDENSRAEWLIRYNNAMKLALQVWEERTWPWRRASNVKYPLVTTAALSFHARAYPMLLPSKNILMAKIYGRSDARGHGERARRVQSFMNYQLMEEMDNWIPDMDKLLITLPITGTEFKKVYYDPEKKQNVSELVLSKDLVVHYYAKSIEDASRKTELIHLSHNQMLERINEGLFLDIFKGDTQEYQPTNYPTIPQETKEVSDKVQGKQEPKQDSDTPHTLLEWHGYYDLDEDGYREPYVVTVHKEKEKVLRIAARFQSENVKIRDGQVVSIKPDEYYTQYTFIPSPDGGIYGLGFGTLVGPLNEAVNSLVNQLVDAGTLSNMQSGFISKSLRLRSGPLTFEPGEWKQVNATGLDLAQGLFPLPVREPSQTLFSLMTFLINAGERLTSTTDLMMGENPGQNQKATTTQIVFEQGQRVFTAIYKRIRHNMAKEFLMLYDLNALYLDKKFYRQYFAEVENYHGGEELNDDFVIGHDFMKIIPTADPNAISHLQKAEKLVMIGQLLQLGTINPHEYTRRYLEELEVDDPEALIIPPPQGPSIEEMELQLKAQEQQVDSEIKMREQDRKEIETLIKYMLAQEKGDVDAVKAGIESAIKQKELSIRGQEAAAKMKQAENKANALSK
jgi:chaperonin GroES